MAFPDVFTIEAGSQRIRAVARTLRLKAFTGRHSYIIFDIVVGVDDPDSISQSILNNAYSPPPNFQMMFKLMPAGSVVLDLGANVGTFALAAAAAGCRVIAVEAAPHNVALLQASVARNQFSHVTVVHAAVSDRVGSIEFVQDGPFGFVANAAMGRATVEVPALPVDDLVKQLGLERVDFLKMDIEGSEVAGIRGMPALLARPDAPPIFYESNGHTLRRFNETPYTLKSALSELDIHNYLCESERLIPTEADELQVDCIVDYLAVKQFPAQLQPWRQPDPLTHEDVIQRILAESQHPNPHHRANLLRAMEAKGGELLSDWRVRQALAALSRDTDPDVNAAAGWVREWGAETQARQSPVRAALPAGHLRIGIDYRILSAGINVNRGMGRYTQQQLVEVLKQDQDNEYVLFCPPFADHSLILPDIRSAPNVSIAVIETSADKAVSDPNQPDKVLRFAEEYQDWIYRQKVDLYHATTPFLWHDTVLPHFDACPMVANFYDAIPFIFPRQYFQPDDPNAVLYARAARFILDSRRFVAISESARQDAIRMIGFPADRIDVAYPIADPCFQVLPAESMSARLRSLRNRANLPEKFVMAVTHLHHSKGIETLLDGYAQVALQLRKQLPLVITCHLTSFEKEYLKNLAGSRGIADQVIITGQVSDEELAALYNAALMLVHPSRYEGFGLPVLEAMQCGTPVITMAASSLPEVGGAAAILIQPDDTQALADAIQTLYQDPERRAAMRQLGFEQARKFDPGQLGRQTLNCYRKAVQTEAVQTSVGQEPSRPTLALWTPLPPQRSGVADYTANILLDPLVQRYDVEVFVDDGVWPSQDMGQSYRVQHYSAFERRQAQRPFDAIVYQLGASLFHVYMYRYLQKYPGVVVLHDLTWSYALRAWLQSAGHTDEFQQELLETEGPEAVKQYRQVMRAPPHLQPAQLIAFLDTRLMLTKIVSSSLGLIVHLPASAEKLRQHYRAEKVFVVPHAAEDVLRSLGGLSQQDARASVGLGDDAFLVGVFGILDPVKRVEATLQAFARLLAEQPSARLVIAGEAYDPAYGDLLHAQVDSLGLTGCVLFTGYVSDESLKRWVLACDVIVNLRYPSRQQMSGTLVRAIAAGKPVIMTDLPEWRFLPAEFCWRVAPDESEVDTLADDLRQFATNGLLLKSASARARAYYESELTPWRMVERYQAVLGQVMGERAVTPPPPPARELVLAALNKPIEAEDFEEPEMLALIRDIFTVEARQAGPDFPRGAEHGRYWAAAMAVRALREAGHLGREAAVLVVGAGRSPLLYYLTRQVGRVFAIDRYLELDHQAQSMLIQPDNAAAYAAELDRLVVQHMDGRTLRFPNESFDAVVVCPSLRHLGSQAEMAGVMYEIGRVLKPGGVVSLTVDHLLAGPPGGAGWDSGRPLLSRAEQAHFVVEASGLELVGELRDEPSNRTLAMPRRLDLLAPEIVAEVTGPPQFVSVVRGYATMLLHLTLRKTAAYPVAENHWARPTPDLVEKIRHESATIIARQRRKAAVPIGERGPSFGGESQPALATSVDNPNSLDVLRARLKALSLIRLKGWYNTRLRRLPAPLAFLARTAIRLLYLGHSQQAEEDFNLALLDHLAAMQSQFAAAAVRFQDLSRRLQDLTSTIHTSQQTLQQEMARELGRLSDYETALRAARSDLETLREEIGPNHAATQQTQFAFLEDQLRQLTSRVRLHDQALDLAAPGKAPPPDLAPGELVDFLRQIERLMPALVERQSVELSLQAGGDETLFAGTAYLGDRMASRSSVYRTPNDLWYHLDFTNDWNRDELFNSATTRLAPAGYFVLATNSDHGGPRARAGFDLVADQAMQLASGKSVRAFVWRRRSEAS